jgi:hypothetical protein
MLKATHNKEILSNRKKIDKFKHYEREIEQLKRLLQRTSSNAIFPSYSNENERKDDICRMCMRWCSTMSHCSNRYNLLHGSFNDAFSDGLDIVPVCDYCMDHNDIEAMTYYGGEIEILGRIFHIDTSVRAND